jgi:hypothetical protein
VIISHKNRFIFIKTVKTAGTSIEIGLSKFCGSDDIITKISDEDEAVRTALGYPGPQNNPNRNSLANAIRGMRGRPLRGDFYNHISAAKVRSLVGDRIWSQYFKFCFERNPWDKTISHYYWKTRSSGPTSLDHFIASSEMRRLKRGGIDLYTVGGDVVVDQVFKYENLHDELERVRALIGAPEPISIPSTKSEFRKDRRHYRDVLNAGQRDAIARVFKAEIDLMGYEF